MLIRQRRPRAGRLRRKAPHFNEEPFFFGITTPIPKFKARFHRPARKIENMITQNGESHFTAGPNLGKQGFWINVGNASVYIRETDTGVSVSLYALGKSEDSIGETYASNDELVEEDAG